MIDIFPYFVGRLSGNSTSSLGQLTQDHILTALVAELQAVSANIETKRKLLCDEIYLVIAVITDNSKKLALIKIRRNIYNGRPISPHEISLVKSFLREKGILLEGYLEDCTKQIFIRGRFASTYEEVIKQHRLSIKRLILDNQFKSGLLLASRSLVNQIDSYQQAPLEFQRKKDANAEVSFLKYLIRMHTRTTPFGSFVNIAIDKPEFHSEKEARLIVSKTLRSKTRVNQFLLFWLRKNFLEIREFYSYIRLGLNRSIIRQADHYLYYSNIDNRKEALHNIQISPFLAHIVYLFQTSIDGLTIQGLINESSAFLEDSQAKIESYLHQLLILGFLELDLNSPNTDDDQSSELVAVLIDQIGSDKFPVYQILEYLDSINLANKQYPEKNFDERKQLLAEVNSKLISIVDILNISKNRSNSETLDADIQTVLQMNIFYEDCYRPAKLTIREVDIVRSLEKINFLLCQGLHSRYRYFDLIDATGLFLTKFDANAEIGLTEFFSHYSRFILSETKEHLTADERKAFDQFSIERKRVRLKEREDWVNKISSFVKNRIKLDQDILAIDRSFFQEYTQPKINEMATTVSGKKRYYSTSFHIYNSGMAGETKPMFYVNGVTVGYGKTFGRFLNREEHLTILESLRLWNKRSMGVDELFIENRDESYSNANIHPLMLPYEIQLNSSVDESPNRITIDQLKVRYNNASGEIELVHNKSDKTCRVFDLGLQGFESRSEMFKFLSIFDIMEVPLFDEFLAIFNQPYIKIHQVYTLPRIVFESDVVIQRKQWHYPKEFLPHRKPECDDASFFLDINRWRIQQNLPLRVFVRMDSDLTVFSQTDRDYYKPQFIQFDSPLILKIFERILKKVKTKLIIEEMLPQFNEYLKSENEPYASEFIVQWIGDSGI